MNDGEYEYAKLLKSMENEVANLKTAHQRPLGALNFFTNKIQFTINLNYEYGSYYRAFRVVVKIAKPTTTPPILQPAWDTPPGFYVVWLSANTISNDYTTYTYDMYLNSMTTASGLVKFGAISSQPIESITWSYT